MADSYPNTASERDRWILQHRGPKNPLDLMRPYGFICEEEIDAKGELLATATIFLTNRECPFRCLMCDLWQNTLDERIVQGAIPHQIRYAVERLPPARAIKLYNAGSFFDPQAIPPEDYDEIVDAVSGFDRVIVECHPAFLKGRTGLQALYFRDQIHRTGGKLEIAIGLETAHPPSLEMLNKRMTLESFREAAYFLQRNDIDLRVFLLLRPPFMSEAEGVEWVCRSLDVAAESGAIVCSIIPTRGGNGAMEALGKFYHPPKLSSLEAAVEYGLSLNRFQVFADLWDVEKFFDCDCSPSRAARLRQMNQTQQIAESVVCDSCLDLGT